MPYSVWDESCCRTKAWCAQCGCVLPVQISTSWGKHACAVRQYPEGRTRPMDTHPHGGMQGAGDLIVVLEARAAPQDLGQPELGHGALHVLDLALRRRRGLHPLGGLAADTADHVGMGEGLGGPLGGLRADVGGRGLRDARVQRRGAAGDGDGALSLVPGDRAVAGGRADEGVGVVFERRTHGDWLDAKTLVLMGSITKEGEESRVSHISLSSGDAGWYSTLEENVQSERWVEERRL